MTADDPVAAHEASLDVEEVHRAALALDDARALAYRAFVTDLCFPVFRVPVLCRHRRPLPTSRYNPKNDEQNNTLRRLVRVFYCPLRPDVCSILRRLFHLASPTTRVPPGRPSPG